MDKLQKLLTLHQNKFPWWRNFKLVIDENSVENWEFMVNWTDDGYIIFEWWLPQLLFNTPFLSWLEWKEPFEYSRISITSYWAWERTDTTHSDYHKINLCLLNSDEDRIKYLEDNVIIDD